MDGLRAMREARHAEMVARSKTAKTTGPEAGARVPSTAKSAAQKVPRAKGTSDEPAGATPSEAASLAESPAESAAEILCGHRNMSGRTCTREQGHAAKSHRYS